MNFKQKGYEKKEQIEKSDLQVALEFIHVELNISDRWLERQYGLHRGKLGSIPKGAPLRNSRARYMDAFVDLLRHRYDVAVVTGNASLQHKILLQLANLYLLRHNLPLIGG